MSDNDKRPNATVSLRCSQNGLVTQIRIWRPISSNQTIWEQDLYNWSELEQCYKKENSAQHVDFRSEPKIWGDDYYVEHSTISMTQAFKELRTFITEKNKAFEIDITKHGRPITYEQLCKELDKSETLLGAKCTIQQGALHATLNELSLSHPPHTPQRKPHVNER